jgi:hypothetical protein
MAKPDVRKEPAGGTRSQDGSRGQVVGNVGVVSVALGVGRFLWSAGEATVDVAGTVAGVAGTVVEAVGTVVEGVAGVLDV